MAIELKVEDARHGARWGWVCEFNNGEKRLCEEGAYIKIGNSDIGEMFLCKEHYELMRDYNKELIPIMIKNADELHHKSMRSFEKRMDNNPDYIKFYSKEKNGTISHGWRHKNNPDTTFSIIKRR